MDIKDFIETNANKYTQELLQCLNEKYVEFTENIPSKILGDITNTLNKNTEIDIQDLTDKDNLLLKDVDLNIGEYIIFNEEKVRQRITIHNPCSPSQAYEVYYSLIITNMSNIYTQNCQYLVNNNGKPRNAHLIKQHAFQSMKPLSIINNLELDPILIKIIQKIKLPRMCFIGTSQLEYSPRFEYIVNFMKEIITINKEHFYRFISSVDLSNKYSSSLQIIQEQQDKIQNLKQEIEDLKSSLYESIPIDHRCGICFGYTDKSQIINPCGHSNICGTCEIKVCPTCNVEVSSIILKK